MFFGKVITEKNSFLYNQRQVDETVGDVICISNAALAPTSKEKATLFARQDGVQYKIADLTKQQPNLPLNFFLEIDEDIQLFIRGNGIVHVVGFFQAQHQIGHLDEVQLHHIHEKQAERNQHNQENNKQIKQTAPQDVKKNQHLKQVQPLNQIWNPQKSSQSQQNDESLQYEKSLDSENQLLSLSELSKEGSPLKGLDDIDDDIGEQRKPHKKVSKDQKIIKNQVALNRQRNEQKVEKKKQEGNSELSKNEGSKVGIIQMNKHQNGKSESKKNRKQQKKMKKNTIQPVNKQKDGKIEIVSSNPTMGKKNNRNN